MRRSGHVWKFGDDLNTDVIHAPEFFSLQDDHVRRGLFYKYDRTIQERLRPGDVLVGGRNFGCGSSRETSVRSLLLNEIGAIVAIDFARIFFRSAINNGIPLLRFARPSDYERVCAGQRVEISVSDAVLRTDDGEEIALEPPGAFVCRLLEAGGLLAML
jgi:3-isopropylmalate dehydratase small subunit